MSFANTAITSDINAKNNDDKLTTAALSLNIDPDGTCASGGTDGAGFEQTGVKAIVMASGPKNSDLIPIDQASTYCWAADVLPVFVIKATKIENGLACSDGSYSAKYKPIANDYTALFIQKRPVALPGHLGPASPALVKNRAEIKKAKEQSQALCNVLKLKQCDAAH